MPGVYLPTEIKDQNGTRDAGLIMLILNIGRYRDF